MMMRSDNYTLIGMPGSGKSTLGPMLAYRLEYEFEDIDWIIEEAEGKQLWQLIEEHGQEGFLDLEQHYATQLSMKHSVIATGGSIIYREASLQHLKSMSTLIYLKVSEEELLRRLGCLSERGVIIKEGFTFTDLYLERTAIYEAWADWTVVCDDKEPKDVVRELVEQHRLQQ